MLKKATRLLLLSFTFVLFFPLQQTFANNDSKVKVLHNEANLYNEDYSTVQQSVVKNTFIVILEKQQQWSKVDVNGAIGYMKNTAMSPANSEIRLVVSSSSPIVRALPEKYAQQIGHVQSGAVVQVYNQTTNGFSLIETKDFTGYVYTSILKVPASKKMLVGDSKGAAVRNSASMQVPIQMTLVQHTEVSVFETKDGWSYIQSGLIQGYVIANKLKDITPMPKLNLPKYNTGLVSKTKRVALTFDDGPHPTVTQQILKSLSKYNAKATFFVTGRNSSRYPAVLKEISVAGHEIGNHTYDHVKLTAISVKAAKQQIDATNKAIESAIGNKATVFRPPYGAYNDLTRQQTTLPFVLWSVDTLDWKHRDANKILQIITSNTKNGSIILMHDIHQPTANGLDAVLHYLSMQGYEFVTVSEILQ